MLVIQSLSLDRRIKDKSKKKGGILKMNKADLIDAIASKTGLTKKDAGAALEAFMDAVRVALKKGNTVTLTGFGTFKVAKRQAREGRNPQTGAKIKIPATTVPKFTAGKALKEAVK